MLILGVDFETSGLCVETDKIIEIGAVLWDTDLKAPVFMQSDLLNHGVNIPEEITLLTGITTEMIEDYGVPPEEAVDKLQRLIKTCNAVCAHNGSRFDRPMYEAHLRRMDIPWVDKPWIDTYIDIDYPERIKTRKLVHLAAEHNFLNPFAHRAVFDVLTMLRVADSYEWVETLRLAREPVVTLKAIVTFAEKDRAKERGYQWDASTKSWLKTLKQSRADLEKTEAPFQTLEVSLSGLASTL
jgi:DNA polymerase-3 subunit epsilon